MIRTFHYENTTKIKFVIFEDGFCGLTELSKSPKIEV